ncbi:MAG: hypothetical protein AAFY76_11295 [Cyanobacteria bacterium J06649_11]
MSFRFTGIYAYILVIFFAKTTQAQDFYIIDTLYDVTTGGTDTRSVIDINTCTLSENTVTSNPTGVSFHPIDMTSTGVSGINIPVSLSIDADPTGNTIPDNVVVYNFWWLFATPGVGPPFAPEAAAKGIATDYNYESYLIGDYVSHVDDLNDIVTPLGLLPANQRPKGQMTYREGSFYYPSINNELIQLKIADSNYWMRSLGNLPDTLNYGGIFPFLTAAIVLIPT